MKEFNVTDGKKDFIFRLPTKLSEITAEYLNHVTANISISPYYAVIASVYRAKLPEVISINKKSRSMAISIIPLFVKAHLPMEADKIVYDNYSNYKTADRIIIAGADIERGYGLSVPNNLITLDTVIRIYNSDSSFAKSVMSDQTYYYFVDFKLVPINDIKGKYDMKPLEGFVNPFAEIKSEELAN